MSFFTGDIIISVENAMEPLNTLVEILSELARYQATSSKKSIVFCPHTVEIEILKIPIKMHQKL